MAISGGDIVDYYMQLERRVARLERTSTVANNQSDTTFVGLLAITGLAVASQTVVSYGTDYQVYVNFSWSAVSLDSNIQTDDPLKGYYTSWTKDGINYTPESFTSTTTATLGPLAQGQNITFRVRAVTQKDTYGDYSSISIATTLDNTAPSQPSTPTATPYLGQVRLFWDGLTVGSGSMPVDLVAVEIHMSTSSITFTPTAATLVDVFYPGGGYFTITDLPYGTTHYFRLVAVDKVGNRSPSSTGVSVVPVQAADGDIATVSIGKLIAGTLSADMTVSARIKTANTGPRAEMNSTGFETYDSGGVRTFFAEASTGNVSIIGVISTAATGQRITLDATGTYPTITLLDNSGATTAYINSPGGGIGVNTAFGTSDLDGSTQVQARMYLVTPNGGRMEVYRTSDGNHYGAYVDVNATTFEGGFQRTGQTDRSYIKAEQHKAELSTYDSGGLLNQIYTSDTQVEINTDPNDDPFNIQLGDGTMYTYGRCAHMASSSLGMFLHNEAGISSSTNATYSWGATMASQVDLVLTIETGTDCRWSMTTSSSTSIGWQTGGGTSISGQANWIGIRR